MYTLIAILLVAFGILFFAYLFRVLSEEEMTEKSMCNSEDYEIADKIALRKDR